MVIKASKYSRSILTVMLLMAVALSGMARKREMAAEGETPELSIECRMDIDKFYERQPVPVVFLLKSSTPEISYARISGRPGLKKGEFDTFQTITPAGRGYEKRENGKTYYYYPLDAFMISMADAGKYEVNELQYTIGVPVAKIVRDPFFGSFRTYDVKEYNVTVPKKQFSVKAIPAPPSGTEFSGSVGNFTIKTIIPKGDIFIDEEATVIIVLSGSGMIAESTLPAYRDAFSKGVQLKSVSESRDEGHDNMKMMSEIRLECTFIPTDSKEAVIGEVTFDYFDPETGKYRTARSEPVKIDVKSITHKRESISI